MKTIWKFSVPGIGKAHEVEAPGLSRILHLGGKPMADGGIFCWGVLDTDAPAAKVEVMVTGTGHALPEGRWGYVNTFFEDSSLITFVWHGWARVSEEERHAR